MCMVLLLPHMAAAQHSGWSTLSIMDRLYCLEYSTGRREVGVTRCSSTDDEQKWQLQTNSSLLRHSSSSGQVWSTAPMCNASVCATSHKTHIRLL